MVLFVEEPVSVQRQLERGIKSVAHNSKLLPFGSEDAEAVAV